MAGGEIAVLRTLAAWLGEGRLVAGSEPLDGAACLDHVTVLCSLRSARQWDMYISVKMLVAIHAGRAAFHLSAYRMMRVVQDETVAALEERLRAAEQTAEGLRRQAVFDNAQMSILRTVEAGLAARISEQAEELRIMEGALESQDEVVADLRAALAEELEMDER
jgi:hypothetical protein